MSKQSSPMMRGLAAALTTIATLVLLVAALMRWREIGWPALIWIAAFVVAMAIRMPHAAANRKNAIVAARTDATEQILLVAMFVTMMALPLLHLATSIFAAVDYALPIWASAIGALMQLPYLWLFWRSHADLGRNWSPGLEVRDAHALVTNGVYKSMRHPMYAAIWIGALAQPLLVHNWIGGALVIPAFAAMYFIRVPREEAMMRQTFGAAYDEYSRTAGRLWPRAAR